MTGMTRTVTAATRNVKSRMVGVVKGDLFRQKSSELIFARVCHVMRLTTALVSEYARL